MKAKKFFKGLLDHRIMRHRQHHRLLHNVGMQIHHFGMARGLMVLGAIAMAGRFLQKRHAARNAHLPEVEGGY